MVNAVDVIKACRWELYHLAEDFSEAVDPGFEGAGQARGAGCSSTPRPPGTTCCRWTTARSSVSTPPSAPASGEPQRICLRGPRDPHPEGAAPNIKNRSFHLAVQVELATGKESGVLVTHGGAQRRLRPAGRETASPRSTTTTWTSPASTSPPRPPCPRANTPSGSISYDGGGFGRAGPASSS